MLGMDCINQQTAQDRDCSHCIWHTDGQCASWDCEYISRAEALEALEKVKAMSTHPNTPNTLEALDCISRQKAIDVIRFECGVWTGLAKTIENKINELPSAQPEIEERMSETEQNVPNDDFISRKRAIDALLELVEARRTWVSIEDARKEISGIDASMCAIHDLPSAQPTLCGYDIDHLMLIADVLRKENLPPERVTEALTDIGRIVSIVRNEFEESLRKAVEHCKI